MFCPVLMVDGSTIARRGVCAAVVVGWLLVGWLLIGWLFGAASLRRALIVATLNISKDLVDDCDECGASRGLVGVLGGQ